MRKYILSVFFFILGILILILFYLSNYGIKTEKFNNLIIKKIKKLEPRISLEINDVFLKLNLKEKSIIINTEDPKVYIDKYFLDLSDISINLNIVELIRKSNSINKIEIITKENSIKNITNFLNSYKFNIPLFVAYNQIQSGSIKAKATLYSKEGNYKKINYEINGNIIDANLNIFNKEKINNINLAFDIKNKKIDLKNISLIYENIKLKSDKINILKNNQNYEISGNLNNDEGLIKPNSLFKLLNLNSNILENEKTLITSENKFSFKVNSERSIKDLKLKSKLKFDKIFINKKYQNLIFLKNGNIQTDYSGKNLKIEIDSGYSFINKNYNNKEDKNNIKINIKKDDNKNIKVMSFFKNENFKINSDELIKYIKFDKKIVKNQEIKINSDNKVNFSIDKKNTITNLNIKSVLNIDNVKVNIVSNRFKNYLPNYLNEIYLNNNYVEIDYSKNKTHIKTKGDYSFKDDYDNYEIDIFKEKNKFNFKSSLDLKNSIIKIKEIDYSKQKGIDSKIRIEGYYIYNDELKFNDIEFLEDNNKIFLSNLRLNNNYKIEDIEKIELNYFNSNKKLNYLKVFKNKNNYEIVSDFFDAQKLIKNLIVENSNTNNTYLRKFKNLNSKISLNLKKLYMGDQSYLNNLEGHLIIKNNKLHEGSIEALLNKNDKFSYNLKTNVSNNEKITNIYIEKPEPFIKNYKFIKGFKEGSLSFNSINKNGLSKSQLKIYDFKVKEVPILAKLLTLASLQGIADLLTGEGIRFQEFEMNYESAKNLTTIKEIYAIGPAISIMIDGYIEKDKLTSLRGTLVPATTINKTISKIPFIGKVLVGSKVGEGVFGVSFKIKGSNKNLKTTVNPIKTLTPRFITRTLEKIKKTN